MQKPVEDLTEEAEGPGDHPAADHVPVDPDDPPYESRPRASRGDDVPLLSNGELARIFYEIGDMMELKGELPFKALAYRRAADAIAHSPFEVSSAYR
ncbi:MAG: helix-hairpin-helix domain-containing protein [Candidatus Limnocylindrales bacterium]